MPKIRQVMITEVECSTRERVTSYGDYLQTRHWAITKAKSISNAHYACDKCGSQSGLHVHHVSYDRIGEEELDDLRVLCNSCHKKEHKHSIEKSYHPWRNGKPAIKIKKHGVLIRKIDGITHLVMRFTHEAGLAYAQMLIGEITNAMSDSRPYVYIRTLFKEDYSFPCNKDGSEIV